MWLISFQLKTSILKTKLILNCDSFIKIMILKRKNIESVIDFEDKV